MDSKTNNCVLIIDNEPSMLCRILSPLYLIKTARNGETGLQMAQKYDIDLIVLDLGLEDITGYEVLTELKRDEKTKNIPVISVTGSEAKGDEIRALTNGAIDYIRKPFVAEIVILRVGIHVKMLTQMRMIERFSLTDGLTGVNNRRCFDQQIEIEWNRSSRNGTWLSLLMMDIDYFKTFNDKYGHLNGDAALKTVANVLVNTVRRGSDYVFRWGGEEFAIILPETPAEGARTVAENIRENIAATSIIFSGNSTNVTASIGASAIIPQPSGYPFGVDEFCETVDKALYKAKELGRNKVVMA